ncbi:shikimate dehydrogenase [Brevundimonas sp.]|uniref:shikimate dehydrogenase n=1 Tax=Brevundimonas sp. TaxID=1871086 RepID=UPI0035B405EF
MTRLAAGVAGNPIGHSLSPVIHQAWIAAAGLDADYRPFEPADAAAFDRLLDTGRAGSLRGLNVTAPFKEQALARADEVAPTARGCGSANLLLFEDGRIRADSTDGAGLLAALSEQAPELNLHGGAAVVLGAGGAARAAVAALQGAGASVTVINRTRSRAEALATDLGALVGGPEALAGADLVVNALSVTPWIDHAALQARAVLMDMTYLPLQTDFLAAGRSRGLTTVDGLAMLIGQARPSFEALFGVLPPALDIRAVALAAMGATA